MEFEKLTQEEKDKLPTHVKIKLGYIALQKEKAEQKKEEQQQEVKIEPNSNPHELLKQAYSTKEEQE